MEISPALLPPPVLLIDLYQLTMAYGYWKEGLDTREALFHLFFRRNPFQGGFAVAAGLEAVVRFLTNFRFQENDLQYLATLPNSQGSPLFPNSFLDYLATVRFTGDVDAVPEGNVVFPFEPLLRVRAPLIQAQLLESSLLNLINFSTLITTKAARMRLAAGNDVILEFGLRRAQGIDGALTASRSSYIGGCDATSNVLAGKIWGIPTKGTHAHSWVMAFDSEEAAFAAYARHMPSDCVLLVDTFNTIEGVKKAIEVGKQLRANGYDLEGVRLDSGDLAYLSIKSRQLLDDAGFAQTKIVASNELDESLISELKRQGACIDVWGIGTHLVTGMHQSALDGVYKLSGLRNKTGEWEYKLKLSEQMIKISNPGILQVRRYFAHGEAIADVIYDEGHGIKEPCHLVDPLDLTKHKILSGAEGFRDLLEPIFHSGRCVYELPTLQQIRATVQRQLACFAVGVKRFINPHQYVVGIEKQLSDLKVALIRTARVTANDLRDIM